MIESIRQNRANKPENQINGINNNVKNNLIHNPNVENAPINIRNPQQNLNNKKIDNKL